MGFLLKREQKSKGWEKHHLHSYKLNMENAKHFQNLQQNPKRSINTQINYWINLFVHAARFLCVSSNMLDAHLLLRVHLNNCHTNYRYIISLNLNLIIIFDFQSCLNSNLFFSFFILINLKRFKQILFNAWNYISLISKTIWLLMNIEEI